MTDEQPPLATTYRPEPHTLIGRLLGKSLCLLAWPRLLVAMRRRDRKTELWIGDSHAMTVNRPHTNSYFMPGPDGAIIVRAGARLMYSLASKGFPDRVMRVVRLVSRFGVPGAMLPIFLAGEIDVRIHLADRPDSDYAFIETYVERCLELVRLVRSEQAVWVVPIPPVDMTSAEAGFPIVGSIDARLAAHSRMRDALAAAVARVPGGVLLDFGPVLASPAGDMPVSMTSDGAHNNAEAIAKMRHLVRTTLAREIR